MKPLGSYGAAALVCLWRIAATAQSAETPPPQQSVNPQGATGQGPITNSARERAKANAGLIRCRKGRLVLPTSRLCN
jgi:hypothetical protein